jgi:hypothetical protein
MSVSPAKSRRKPPPLILDEAGNVQPSSQSSPRRLSPHHAVIHQSQSSNGSTYESNASNHQETHVQFKSSFEEDTIRERGHSADQQTIYHGQENPYTPEGEGEGEGEGDEESTSISCSEATSNAATSSPDRFDTAEPDSPDASYFSSFDQSANSNSPNPIFHSPNGRPQLSPNQPDTNGSFLSPHDRFTNTSPASDFASPLQTPASPYDPNFPQVRSFDSPSWSNWSQSRESPVDRPGAPLENSDSDIETDVHNVLQFEKVIDGEKNFESAASTSRSMLDEVDHSVVKDATNEFQGENGDASS